jgi:hypothetical protein
MAILEDALFVIRDTDDESVIDVYNKTTGKFKKHLTIPGMGTLSDMTSCWSHDCVYITDSTHKAVYRIEFKAGNYEYKEWSVSLAPRSISVTSSSNVLVTFHKVAGEYSPSGELQRVVNLQKDVIAPSQVVELDVDQFLVSDIYLGSNRLCIVNELGQKVKCVKAGSAHEPIHVAVHGFVYVTDVDNDSVMMLTSLLTYIRDVVVELDMPYRLLHSDGELYVADLDEEASSRLKLYRIME